MLPSLPKKRVRGTAVGYEVAIKDLQWSGVMTVTYAGGDRRDFKVTGSFDSASATRIQARYAEEDL